MARTSPTKADAQEEARLLETREILPGRKLQVWHAPALARGVAPGQYLYLREPRPAGLLLPALPVAGYDRVAGTISLLPTSSGPARGLASLRTGDGAHLEGPLGRGFALDPRSRYLLLVADVEGLPRVRAAVDEAVAGGRQVTVLLGAPDVAAVYPSSLLPDEAEYVVATADGSLGHHGSLIDLLPAYEAWADQCFAATSPSLLATLAAWARGRDARMGVARLGRRRGRRAEAAARGGRHRTWLQVALAHPAGCALGICSGCVLTGVDGPARACREGPTFAAEELRWEPAR
jgi:dihydroorotate dehydrogenase electron transfer subunit